MQFASSKAVSIRALRCPVQRVVEYRAFNEEYGMRKYAAAVLFVIVFCAVPYVQADTYYVDLSRPDDSGAATNWATAKKTIQAAVDLAVDGDTVVISDGGYVLSSAVAVSHDITIRSKSGFFNVTAVSGNGVCRCFYLGTTHSRLSGMGFMNGFDAGYGGGIYCDGTNAVISECMFFENKAGYGGGIYGGTCKSCEFKMNEATSHGGGIYLGTAFNCNIYNNSSTNYGGGVSASIITKCLFEENSAENGGGAAGSIASNCTFRANVARRYGGGMNGGDAVGCHFIGNKALSGGGKIWRGAIGCIFENNIATDNGGGIASGSVASNCLFVGNHATRGGGGYFCSLNNCTVSSNTAERGGGTYSCYLTNSIVYYNKSSVSGDNIEPLGRLAVNTCSADGLAVVC